MADPLVFDLLDTARAIFDSHLIALQAMAEESTPEEPNDVAAGAAPEATSAT